MRCCSKASYFYLNPTRPFFLYHSRQHLQELNTAMQKDFFKGCSHAFIYYLIGAALAFFAHLAFEDVYTLERGSRLYHQIITLTWLGGCAWTLFGIYQYMRGKRKVYYAGVVALNLLVVVAVFTWVYLLPASS